MRIKRSELSLRREVNTGEGFINSHITTLLNSGEVYTREQAAHKFDELFRSRLAQIASKIEETMAKKDVFKLIFDTYKAFEETFPSIETIHSFLAHFDKERVRWQMSAFTRASSLNECNMDLPRVWTSFKTIDAAEFQGFYIECCTNIAHALKSVNSCRTWNHNALLEELANYGLKLKDPHASNLTSPVRLEDLRMFSCSRQNKAKFRKDEPEKKNFLARALDELKCLITGLPTNDASTTSNRQLLFGPIILKFIQHEAIANTREWPMILDGDKFEQRVSNLIDTFIGSSSKREQGFDHELVQALVMKLEQNIFAEYNDDLKSLGLKLGREAKTYANKLAFKKLYEHFQGKLADDACQMKRIWMEKRESLLHFFVSQLVVDDTTNKENAKQFVRTFAHSIDVKLAELAHELAQRRLEEREAEFSRMKLQEKRDETLISLNQEQLLEFVLDPTSCILEDFDVLWRDFQNKLRQDFHTIRAQYVMLFDELKRCLQSLASHLAPLKTSAETLNAQNLFQLAINNNNNSTAAGNSGLHGDNINKSVYFKGLCVNKLLFDLLCESTVDSAAAFVQHEDTNYTRAFSLNEDIKAKLTSATATMTKPSDQLRHILSEIRSKLAISIANVDIFLQNCMDLVESEMGRLGEKDFMSAISTQAHDKYVERVKGCQTKCPCCGRMCDAEHFKVQTAIGSPTNKHRCNRGHQYRAMNGFKMEHSNQPSFKMCESIDDSYMMVLPGPADKSKSIRWSEYKTRHPSWDFAADLSQDVHEWRIKCSFIWSKIGKQLCTKFDMTYSTCAVDVQPALNPNAIHFILVLDNSTSMRTKWNALYKSVKAFLTERHETQRSDDLVSIITFATTASVFLSNASIESCVDCINLLERYSLSGNGLSTNYAAALNEVIQLIGSQSQDSSHVYEVVFMSDGEASYPGREMHQLLLMQHYDKIKRFWCIGYGCKKEFSVLKKMTQLVHGDEEYFKMPDEKIEGSLDRVYREIARFDWDL